MVVQNGYLVNPKTVGGQAWADSCGHNDWRPVPNGVEVAEREAQNLSRHGEACPSGWGIQ